MAFCKHGVQPNPIPSAPGAIADEPQILDRRLPMLDRLAVDGVADHGDEGGDGRIVCNKAEIPALLRRPISICSNRPRQMIDPPRREKTGSLSRP